MSSKTNKSNSKSGRIQVGMISLGCAKTLVDSETILGKLDPSRYQINLNPENSSIVLLNTCSFIGDAQKESVDKILELIELKKRKQIDSLVVMGCLVQEFPKDLKRELKEVDAFIGSGEYHKIPEIVSKVTAGEKVFTIGTPGYLATSAEPRIALTPRHSRYLKISEGCDHICTFCTIPTFRGKHRSRPLEDIVREAGILVEKGAKEIILTGQDTTYYGRDFDGRFLLPELLRALNQVPGAEWIRLLYAYPSCVNEEMMDAIRDSEHVCKYLDMPLQHASDRMLTAMKRGITQRKTRDLISRFRAKVKGLAIRTTFIVGFPGETEEDFDQLLDFMDEIRFERAGVFKYSQETGAPAGSYEDQISEEVKQERYDRAMQCQQKISMENNKRFVGKKMRVLIENKKNGIWIARTEMDAPDIDGIVKVNSRNNLEIGSFYDVQITDSETYDLIGQI